jgi:hypothetical protein
MQHRDGAVAALLCAAAVAIVVNGLFEINMKENDNNFGALRRLLKLKRHESPPPGYFNRFSGQVVARIRAGEARRPSSEISWLAKLLSAFEFKPAFAGAFASALCLVLAFGIFYAEQPDGAAQSQLQTAGQSDGFAAALPASLSQGADSFGIIASNNAANSLQPVASLFGGAQNQFAQPVSFTLSGN